LSKQIGSSGITIPNIQNPVNMSSIAASLNMSSIELHDKPSTSLSTTTTSTLLNPKKAKVLFDYDATDPSEISVSANQVTRFLLSVLSLFLFINVLSFLIK
jgi:uncharacterized membrane protein